MSTSLIMILDREISKEFVNKPIKMFRKYDNLDIEVGIWSCQNILKESENYTEGYKLQGFAYCLDRSTVAGAISGVFYDYPLNSDLLNNTLILDLEKECRWVFNIIKTLLNDGYCVKLFIGELESPYFKEEFEEPRRLSIENLKNIFTVLDYNVLYEVYDEEEN